MRARHFSYIPKWDSGPLLVLHFILLLITPLDSWQIALAGLLENRKYVSKRNLFETNDSIIKTFLCHGYRLVSKLISKSTSQYLTNAMSFDTILLYAPTP